MRVRTTLLVLLGAITVIAAADAGIRVASGHLPELSRWPTVETELKATQLAGLSPEVLVIGSSMTEAAFDPDLFIELGAAESAYNASFPFYSPAAVEIWLTELAHPWRDLEFLILGVPHWPPPDSLDDDPLAVELAELASGGTTANPLDELPLLRFRKLLGNLDEAAERRRTLEAGFWTELGHQTFYYDRSGDSLVGKFHTYRRTELPLRHRRALARMIETARAAGVQPILMIEPGRHPDNVPAEVDATYLRELESLAAEMGVPLWDTYSLHWDASNFADEVHFNRNGTERFTELLAEMLIEFRS